MNFYLSRVNTVTFNDIMVDIDLSVYEKSSAETMASLVLFCRLRQNSD